MRNEWSREDEQSSAGQIGAFLSGLFWIGGFWFVAIFFWSVALDQWQLQFLLAATLGGGIVGLIGGLVIGTQTSKTRAREMKFGSAAITAPAILIFLIGLVVWVVRLIL